MQTETNSQQNTQMRLMPNKLNVKEAHNKFDRHFSQFKRNMQPTKEETQTPKKR